jgi:F-type H+-transporting ATPase subunit delta
MKYSAKQYAQALMDSLSVTDPKDTDKVLDNFVKVLAEHNDLRMYDQISEEFHKIELEKKGIKQVEITSAMPLSKQAEAEIVDKLNQIVKGQIEVSKKIDERLIGGVVVRLEDQVLDASVKNNLENLKKELSK